MQTYRLNQPANNPINLTPYELEADPKYGGACVLRMILNSARVNPDAPAVPGDPQERIPPNTATQDLMFTDAKQANDAGEGTNTWHLDPGAMEEALDRLDQSTTRSYLQYIDTDQAEANRKIVYTLEQYRVAPAAVVGGGPQWVAVTGFDRDDDGTTLRAFYVHDPSENGPGTPDSLVAAAQWGPWFTKVARGVRWHDRFVTVCDPQPERAEVTGPVRRPRRPGDRLITPEEAVELAREAVEEHELARDPKFKEALERGRVAEPRLVQATELEDTFYYIVPFVAPGDERTTLAAICVDARFGDLWNAAAEPEGFPCIRITPEEAVELVRRRPPQDREPIERVVDRLVEHTLTWADRVRSGGLTADMLASLQDTLTRQLILEREPVSTLQPRRETLEVARTLVWQVSQAGVSPRQAFYVVQSPTTRYYVKAADGRVFSQLLLADALTMGG